MTEMALRPVTMGSTDSLVWIDEPPGIDRLYLDTPEEVPQLASQANFDDLITNTLERLFFYTPPDTWAQFFPYIGYKQQLRRLFKFKVQSTIDIKEAIDGLDSFFEDISDFGEEGEKIYEMLYSLDSLNDLLESIYLRILSALKS